MIEPDTIKLLRECDAGIKMGMSSIDDVLKYVEQNSLKKLLVSSKNHHEQLKTKIQEMLDSYQDEGKNPNVMAKTMSWIKTNVKLTLKDSDHTIADLMMEGCDMGVRSLSRYLNQYKGAEEKAKDIAKELITIEEELSKSMRQYL